MAVIIARIDIATCTSMSVISGILNKGHGNNGRTSLCFQRGSFSAPDKMIPRTLRRLAVQSVLSTAARLLRTASLHFVRRS
jgi:hypothetical protein